MLLSLHLRDHVIDWYCKTHGMRYGGTKRRGAGYTVYFQAGTVGNVEYVRLPRKELNRLHRKAIREEARAQKKANKKKNRSKNKRVPAEVSQGLH